MLFRSQSRTVVPVGSNKAIPIDIRLLSATNCPIEKMVSEKTFREDLMYRLNTIHINVPPLRERGDDIEWLAAHFLKQFEKKYRKKNMRLDSAAIRKLKRYPWPGNVRELQHTIEKAVILASKDILGPDDFEFKEDFSSLNEDMFTLEQMEQRLITAALSKHHDNLTLAAKQLGISRQTLYNKIKRDEH